jgi:hypothetical protein
MVKNACGTVSSPVFTVTITACTNLPSVTDPSDAQTRAVNKNGTLTISVTGNGNGETPAYQWQTSTDGTNNWTDISVSGVSTDYNVPTGTAGTYYFRCKVSNSCSYVFSPVFTVTVRPCSVAPSITSPGDDQSTKLSKESTSPILSVSTGEEGTLSYQWQTSATGEAESWADIDSNGNSASYSAPTATAGVTYYRCVVSNECGGTASPKFRIQVTDCTQAPGITSPTVDQTSQVNKDGTLYLEIAANGYGETELSYQWKTSSDGVNNWNNVSSGGTGATCGVPAATAGTYYYRCEVSNSCGTTTSVKFTVTVRPCTAAPTITAAGSYTYTINKSASQSITVSAGGNGDSSLSYQWQSSTTGPDAYNWQNANGTGNATATYSVPSTAAGVTYYRCMVNNSCGETFSGVYTVTVRSCTAAPSISSPTSDQTPANQLVGATYAMSVTATVYGASSTAYQWQSSTTGNDGEWANVSNATTNSFNAPTATDNLGTTYYRCVVTTDCGEVVSKKWKITVVNCTAAPIISSPSSDVSVIVMNDGTPYSMSVTATVYGAPSTAYQWQSSATGEDNEWSNIDDAITNSYDAPTDDLGITYYRCRVTTDCGSAFRKWTVTVTDCPGYVCSNCAFDYSSAYDDVPGDGAKGQTPSSTDNDESWAPNVQIGDKSYITEDTKLFSAFSSADKDLCVYKADGNSGNQATWPNAVSACNGTVDGFDDWYLPNLRELRALYNALGGNGSSTTGSSSDFAGGSAMRSNHYWSSTEYSATYAYTFNFNRGPRYYYNKANYYYVRCVRRM